MSDRSLTRRTLLGTAAAGAATAAAPGAEARSRRRRGRRRKRADVVVVGAGIAGLTAARELVKAGVKSVVVLEARKRVGGRTYTKTVDGVPVDVGGQWIKTKPTAYGPAQERITALAKELGVKTFPAYYQGQNLYYNDGQLSRYDWEPTQELPPAAFPQAAQIVVELDRLATGTSAGAGTPKTGPGVSPTSPWTSPRAAEFDGMTAETWKQQNTHDQTGRELADLGIQAIFACEPRDISLLYVLNYIAQAGSLENLISTPLGYQERRFVDGAQTVSKRMAEELGRRVVTNSAVSKIVQRGRKVRVESRKLIVTADRAILAMTPALTAAIDFRPGLPADRAQLAQRTPMGSVIKCQATYDKPFWRDDGLTGFTISDTGPSRVTWDNTPANGKVGVLLGFIEGHDAREWGRRSAADRRQAMLECFARYFGDRALRPREYADLVWADERWSRGCYVGYTAPGVLLEYGVALRAPFGPVHWAGTETATVSIGYMDGAVQSGERAAREVLSEL
jgi:monoamine oxidase